ncbi:MAG: ABC transporter ATP-binding protein [Sideroxyarcus sp.]
MSTVITVESLSKKYLIGHQKQASNTTLRDALANGAKHFTHKLFHPFSTPARELTQEEFWALKDVSFSIQQGDRVGIIGRNGAGKSTLLKILSRITEPTSGRVSIKGRVASLLEVGTGFHPELSGRENVFLNGAILGMSKAEIKNKFDEIVAFAEIERFLDTPVKRYSSGMYVRLAFAVAAHLDPEILIVDEVLAVGDAQFQKKCMGKMEDAGKEGRTVLFVSHNMASIQQLCSNGILLRDGMVRDTGPIVNVIESYLNDSTSICKDCIGDMPRTRHDYGVVARFIDAYPVNNKGEITSIFKTEEDIAFNLRIKAFEQIDSLSVIAGVNTYLDYRITTVLSEEAGQLFAANKNAVITINLKLPGFHLKPGIYTLTLGVRSNRVTLDHVAKAVHFEVSEVSANSRSQETYILGDILVNSSWSRLVVNT